MDDTGRFTRGDVVFYKDPSTLVVEFINKYGAGPFLVDCVCPNDQATTPSCTRYHFTSLDGADKIMRTRDARWQHTGEKLRLDPFLTVTVNAINGKGESAWMNTGSK